MKIVDDASLASHVNGTEDSLTHDQQMAWEMLLSDKSVFLTGAGGTGKTYLLRRYLAWLADKGTNVVCCAPTGLAAQNLPNGMTLHRAFKVPLTFLPPDAKPKPQQAEYVLKWLRDTDVIVIDEISMCRIDVFEYVMRMIKRAEIGQNGIGHYKKIVLVGDFFQLAPVIHRNEEGLFREFYSQSPNGYCFNSSIWSSGRFVFCDLKEPVRQAKDSQLYRNLDLARRGNPSCIPYFNRLVRAPSKDDERRCIRLFGRKQKTDAYNDRVLDSLSGESFTFRSECRGRVDSGDKPAPDILSLKRGTRVMVLANDSEENPPRYVNGSMGFVVDGDEHEQKVLVELDGKRGEPVWIERYTWKVKEPKVKETVDEDGQTVTVVEADDVGSYMQVPVKPAYALTTHKAQGQTFERLIVDPESFAPGQLYVALSRAVSAGHLYLTKPILREWLICSSEVQDFQTQSEIKASDDLRAKVDSEREEADTLRKPASEEPEGANEHGPTQSQLDALREGDVLLNGKYGVGRIEKLDRERGMVTLRFENDGSGDGALRKFQFPGALRKGFLSFP